MNMLEKCKESQPVIQRIIETTTDDESMLFEALYLHEELQQVISKYEELEASQNSGGQQLENPDATRPEVPEVAQNHGELPGNSNPPEREDLDDIQNRGGKLPEYSIYSEVIPSAPVGTHSETKIVESVQDSTSTSSEKVGH